MRLAKQTELAWLAFWWAAAAARCWLFAAIGFLCAMETSMGQ